MCQVKFLSKILLGVALCLTPIVGQSYYLLPVSAEGCRNEYPEYVTRFNVFFGCEIELEEGLYVSVEELYH